MIFIVALVVLTIIVGITSKRKRGDNIAGTIVIGGFAVFILNLVVCAAWFGGYDEVNVPIEGTVQTKIVNSEASFVFRAGGQDYVYSTDEVTLSVGQPRLVIESTSDASNWWTLFPTEKTRREVFLTVNPS